MNVAASAIVGAVAGWIAGVVLTVVIRWASMTLFDTELTLRGLEFVGMAGGIILAIVLGRRERQSHAGSPGSPASPDSNGHDGETGR